MKVARSILGEFRGKLYAFFGWKGPSFLCLLLFANTLWGFHINNQIPFFHIFGVPSPEPAQISSGKLTLISDMAHTSFYKTNGSSVFYVRGESFTFNLVGDYGLGDNWQIGFELPYIFQRGSYLQEPIDEYHHLLGLGRVGTKEGEDPGFYLNIPGGLCYLFEGKEDFGDLILKLKRNIYRCDKFLASGLLYWKLPTGDKEAFTGSGSHDYSVALSFAHPGEKFGFDHFWSYSYLGEFEPLQDFQRSNFFTLDCGVDYYRSKSLTWRAQLNGSSAYYKNTGFSILDQGSLQLIFGAKYRKQNWEWQFFMGEDLFVLHSPDVSLTIVTAYHF